MESYITRSLRTLLLGCDASLYCGLSLLWENPALRDSPFAINRSIVEFSRAGAINAVSQYPAADEFIETRRELYKHDMNRYPLYYSIKAGDVGAVPGAATVKETSATRELSSRLDSWAQGGVERVYDGHQASDAVKRAVRKALFERGDRAVTFALFRPYLASGGRVSAKDEYAVRRQISRAYTSHYMAHAFGDLATGVPGLSFFDSLSRSFPDYDVEILGDLISLCGLGRLLSSSFEADRLGWVNFASRRGSDLFFVNACRNFRVIVRTLHHLAVDGLRTESAEQSDLFGIRAHMKMSINSYLRKTSVDVEFSQSDYISKLAAASHLLLLNVQNQRELRRAYEMADAELGEKSPRLLLATVTAVERDAVLRIAGGITGAEPVLEFGSRRGYYSLGNVGGVDVFLVQSEMGTSGPGGSIVTVADALDDIKPIGVIMVGIAFGVDDKKQEIGEILVSRQLQSYDLMRVGTDHAGGEVLTPRGDRVTASSSFLSRLRMAEVGWTGKRVRFGCLLSGEKLVDNKDYRGELQALFPEADGGEMEGAGVYTAAIERHVNWIVVKAVCDWADGNKSRNKTRRQAVAAEQAASFVFRAVQQGGFQVLLTSD